MPIEETIGAMARLIEQGKVRYLGLSEAGAQDNPSRARDVSDHRAAKRVLALDARPRGRKFSATCRELGIGFVPYSPLGRGFLTGQVKKNDFGPDRDFRRMSPRFQGENFQKNLEIVRRVEQMAAEKKCTPAQLALAWVLAKGEDVVPIPGTKRRKYIDENLAALEVSLTAADFARLDGIAPPRSCGVARGIPDEYMNRLGL